MPRYRLLALDVDGTLVNSRDELTPATRDALARARQAGIGVVVATGRRYSRTLHLVEPLAIDVPLVTSSGALVKDPADHRTLYRAEFEPELLRRVLEITTASGFDALLCGDSYAEGFDFYYSTLDVSTPELAEYIALNPDCGRHWPGMLQSPPADTFLVFTMGTREQMLALEERLNGELAGLLTTHVLRSPRYRGYLCEVSPVGVTKWSAVERLASGWGIDDAAICAVGDDVNDIAMIQAAGLGVAMGNAQEPVKAAADLVIPGHDEDGLVWLVERLLADEV
jgi:Cof subfamily protein (haloacid dehalogenase superfamily)